MINGLLSVLVANAGVYVFYLIMRLFFGDISKQSFIAYYFILLPVGFAAWDEPWLLLLAPFPVAGVVILSRVAYQATARARS